MKNCTICNQEKELRPYGKGGALICFECMKATPETEEEAKKQFAMQLGACGEIGVIGEEVGPYPFKHYKEKPTYE